MLICRDLAEERRIGKELIMALRAFYIAGLHLGVKFYSTLYALRCRPFVQAGVSAALGVACTALWRQLGRYGDAQSTQRQASTGTMLGEAEDIKHRASADENR